MWQVTYLFLFRALTDLVEHVASGPYSGVLDTAWCGLYQTPTTPITANATLANITEANYVGYARQAVTWFPVIQGQAGVEVVYAQNLFYAPTDVTIFNQITGVFLASASYGGDLLMAAALATPGISFNQIGQGLVVKPTFSLTTLQVYGSPDVES